MSKKSPTIRDVAKLAGVSHQTVSRVINDSSHVLPATRERVNKAIAELGYRPNAIARSMALGKTKNLAYIAPNLADYTFASILQASEAYLRSKGYTLLISTAENEQELKVLIDDLVTDGRVDGLVIQTPIMEEYHRKMLGSVPFVFVGVDPQLEGDFTTIDHDNYQISQLAVDHLVSLGHRRIATIIGMEREDCVEDRIQGFRDQMQIHGCELREDWSIVGDWSASSGYQAAETFLHLPERPTAIYAQNDRMAIGAIHAARDLGFRVPEDISVMGVDDIPLSQHFSPPLTTVRQDFSKLGHRTADLLLENLIIEQRNRHVRMPVELIVRSSTGPVLR
jgi:LacI family repressor for deo operon, udp, cdd, tsx, nupC, and nupG